MPQVSRNQRAAGVRRRSRSGGCAVV